MAKLARPHAMPLAGVKLLARGKPGEGGVVELTRGDFHSVVLVSGPFLTSSRS